MQSWVSSSPSSLSSSFSLPERRTGPCLSKKKKLIKRDLPSVCSPNFTSARIKTPFLMKVFKARWHAMLTESAKWMSDWRQRLSDCGTRWVLEWVQFHPRRYLKILTVIFRALIHHKTYLKLKVTFLKRRIWQHRGASYYSYCAYCDTRDFQILCFSSRITQVFTMKC